MGGSAAGAARMRRRPRAAAGIALHRASRQGRVCQARRLHA